MCLKKPEVELVSVSEQTHSVSLSRLGSAQLGATTVSPMTLLDDVKPSVENEGLKLNSISAFPEAGEQAPGGLAARAARSDRAPAARRSARSSAARRGAAVQRRWRDTTRRAASHSSRI